MCKEIKHSNSIIDVSVEPTIDSKTEKLAAPEKFITSLMKQLCEYYDWELSMKKSEIAENALKSIKPNQTEGE